MDLSETRDLLWLAAILYGLAVISGFASTYFTKENFYKSAHSPQLSSGSSFKLADFIFVVWKFVDVHWETSWKEFNLSLGLLS